MESIEVAANTLDEAMNVVESKYREGYIVADITLRKVEAFLQLGKFLRVYHFTARVQRPEKASGYLD